MQPQSMPNIVNQLKSLRFFLDRNPTRTFKISHFGLDPQLLFSQENFSCIDPARTF
jgi:hypothetical protein